MAIKGQDQTTASSSTRGKTEAGYSSGASAPSHGADVDWNVEDRYWRENFPSRSYYENSVQYTDYQPAYRYGTDLYNRYGGKRYEDIKESDLRQGWERMKESAALSWDKAKHAVRDAYERLFNR
ncbi:MAG: hypothetical protein KGJ06_01325 [Pseudomonadota bacterium]|nr:hypothetical protein [Pseudomonadota bacterium]